MTKDVYIDIGDTSITLEDAIKEAYDTTNHDFDYMDIDSLINQYKNYL